MKKTAILLAIILAAATMATAQKPVFESATQSFGYTGDNGTWSARANSREAPGDGPP